MVALVYFWKRMRSKGRMFPVPFVSMKAWYDCLEPGWPQNHATGFALPVLSFIDGIMRWDVQLSRKKIFCPSLAKLMLAEAESLKLLPDSFVIAGPEGRRCPEDLPLLVHA